MLRSLLALFQKSSLPAAWQEYTRHARSIGLRETSLFLSFDCDTDLDAKAVLELLPLLAERNIKATFAVPGAQIERQTYTYKHIADAGHEFMNHGMRPHAAWDGEKYYGITFYNEMSRQEVEDDICDADATLRRLLGITPKGFRAPHFGCFQKAEQLDFMHSICADLGYIYASTTVPAFALERGPAFLSQGIVELPLLGSWRDPAYILDSWAFLEDRVNYRLSGTYFELLEETLVESAKRALPLLLSLYVDPAHVLNQPPFIKALDMLASKNIPNYSGTECAKIFKASLESVCAA